MPLSRRFAFPLLLLLTLGVLSGCTTVVSQQPVGAVADADSALELSRDWKTEKGRATFSDAGNGQLSVQVHPPKEGVSAPPPFNVELRRSGDKRYASLMDPDDDEARGYLFLRYTVNEGGHIVGWIPDTKVFRDAIDEGRLAGEVLGNRVSRTILITAGQAELDAFLNDIEDDVAWETNHPVVIWNPDAPDTPK